MIIHSCNLTGVLRDPDDKSGDFDVFSKKDVYSTFKFCYKKEEFDDIHNLMKFNTFINKEVSKKLKGIFKPISIFAFFDL